MPPFIKDAAKQFDEVPDLEPVEVSKAIDAKKEHKRIIVWRNVIYMALIHIGALYGLSLVFTSASIKTTLLAVFFYQISGLGVTAGCHRLWSHKAYKARLPLRILLAFLQTMAYQDSFGFAMIHHKGSETDADPHDSRRGFFFAHCGWLLVRKNPEVIRKGKLISMDDLMRDPVVRFQRKYYLALVALCCFVIPTYAPHYLFGETLWNAFFICGLLRYVWTLHMTWLVNSAAHFWGRHPYDDTINPAENYLTVVGAIGEGFHNFHHTFPQDYQASELGMRFNLSTMFINAMAAIGQAYDLKTVSPEVIRKRKERTGDVARLGNYGLYHPVTAAQDQVNKAD